LDLLPFEVFSTIGRHLDGNFVAFQIWLETLLCLAVLDEQIIAPQMALVNL
jgi:hypothetical protein